MPRHELEHKPGGFNSDVVETDLGEMWYEEVKNLRQVKKGEWSVCPGHKTVFPVASNDLKAGIEINDDLSGDRFLLLQIGTALKRVEYNLAGSPAFGYENESATTITLPSGVTIDSSVVLRFFVHDGIVRITGASEPLRYEYIKRKLFDNKWSDYYPITDNMVGHPYWNGTNATSVSDSTHFHGTADDLAAKITQTALNGYVYRSFQIVVGESYTVSVWVYKETAGSDGDPVLSVGRTKGGTEYGTDTDATKDAWVQLSVSFTAATNGRLYVGINPGSGAANDILWIDDFSLDITSNGLTNVIQIDNWYLKKAVIEHDDAMLQLVDIGVTDNTAADPVYVFAKYFLIYDNQQYSLPKPLPIAADKQLTLAINDFHILTGTYSAIYLRLKISETFSQRITGIGILLYVTDEPIYDEDSAIWKVAQVIYLDEALDPTQYVNSDVRYLMANPNELALYDATATGRDVKDGFWMADTDVEISRLISGVTEGSMRTVCTAVDFLSTAEGIITLLDTIYPPLLSADVDTTMTDVVMKIYRRWIYSSNNYYVSFGAQLNVGIEYEDFTGIPSTIEDNNPNYTHHVVIEGIAYVNSQEDDEEDQIRYSPIHQLDNFPVTNIFPTDFGTKDTIKALVKRDNRLVILKGDLIGQGNFVGGNFYHDTESPGDGMFPTNGYLIVGKTLLYIDKDDVYQFGGVAPSPLLSPARVRNRFLAGITVAGFLLENKLNNEIWIYLPDPGAYGEFLVYNPTMQEWYIRTVDYVALGGFIDADRKMIVYSASKLLTYDHTATTFTELVTWEFTLKLLTERFARYSKKLHEINLEAKNSEIVECIVTDEEDATTLTQEIDVTNLVASILTYTVGFTQPKFFYKQLNVKIRNKTAATNLAGAIRRIVLKVDNWR